MEIYIPNGTKLQYNIFVYISVFSDGLNNAAALPVCAFRAMTSPVTQVFYVTKWPRGVREVTPVGISRSVRNSEA